MKKTEDLFSIYCRGFDSGDFGSSVKQLMNEEDFTNAMNDYKKSIIEEIRKQAYQIEYDMKQSERSYKDIYDKVFIDVLDEIEKL